MEIRMLQKEDIRQVAELECRTYPRWMCSGYDAFMSLIGREGAVAVGAFRGTELSGYMIGFPYLNGQTMYVADLVSQNPKSLLPMMQSFFSKCEGKITEAECREASHTLMLRLQDRFPGLMTIHEDRKMPGYYRGEDGYRLVFEIHDAAKMVA